MSYFLGFIKSLDEEELGQFSQLQLVGKERLVSNEYVNHKSEKKFNEASIPTRLQLSKSHFDKINSVLLEKAIEHFAGNKLSDKLDFLIKKQLHDLILHKLKVNEKILKKQNNKKELKEFYALAFQTTMLFNFNSFPEKQLEHYCESYAGILQNRDENRRYEILAKHQEMLIRYFDQRINGAKKKDKALKNLLAWQKEVKKKKYFESEVAICLGVSAFYEGISVEKCLQYILEADHAARKVYNKIEDRDKAFLIAMTALQLIDLDRFIEAKIKYEELFSKFGRLVAARLFHPYQYVVTLLILKDFKGAADVMKKYIEPFLKNENARNFHFDILRLYSVYNLLIGETGKAGKYLQQILQFGKQDFTPLGDVLFRLVHNVYCAQTGDYVLAADVLKKNIKYVDSKIEIEGFVVYKQMLLDLGKVIRYKSKGDTNKKSSPVDEISSGTGTARLFMNLIKLPLQK